MVYDKTNKFSNRRQQAPNHFIWLCFFYLSFHSFLNLVGEVMHFADRNFYGDWWNANNIDTFWRSWNMPVHRWCVRHVYLPIVELGYGKAAAVLVVFFISAFFHEFLVSNRVSCVSKLLFFRFLFGIIIIITHLLILYCVFEQVSVPLKTFKIWAFIGMMAQLPLSYFSRYMEKNYGPRCGNIVVWASIILGQPLCIMMYYHDYVVMHLKDVIRDSEL